MNAILLILIAVISYFLGGINGAIIISQLFYKKDIRDYGSGNAGATNMLRVFGGVAAGMVVAIDILKSVLAVSIGAWLFGFAGFPVVGKLFAGFCLMMGHAFPAFYGLKGGRGVICGAVTLFMTDWRIGLICIAIFAAVLFATRYVSLGSIVAAITFPIAMLISPEHTGLQAMLSLCCALLVVYMHRENISRLVAGTESKISIGGKKPAP